MTADASEGPYQIFQTYLEHSTPAKAIKDLQTLGVPPATIEAIRSRFEAETRAVKELDEPHVVVTAGRDTWYTGPRASDAYWPAVRRILQRQNWDDQGLQQVDDSSTRIVSLLNHPHEKTFQSRGLVVGYVQSGKTTNFTSVIAKATDRGYKFVIVLSGIHNGLRRQTQRRLEQQLVDPNPSHWLLLTDVDHDFVRTKNPAAFFGKKQGNKVLCVVKKNATVLRKLAGWLRDASDYLVDTPALIIDDEADQATVATKTINPLIRGIMNQLPRNVYIGYTASPFANLLIDPAADDLYPRDFVVNLPQPRGHFGPEVIFGRDPIDGDDPEDVWDGYDMVRTVPDEEIAAVRPAKRADIDSFAPEIDGSLQEAVEYFLLATAARRVRGTGNPHSTMLVHTSVSTAVHNSFRDPLHAHLRGIGDGLDDPRVIDRLRRLWEDETKRVLADDFHELLVPFDKVRAELPGVLQTCRIVMDNSSSEDRLDYENGPIVAIAVGGNTLSRGLTLEGLCVSYFVRSVSAYDTLLQMGRWFGFRNGYADLPRIWMTDELREWFRHLAAVEHEMRKDIDRYMTEDLTPTEFAVRLRTHPSLLVTARAKMKDAIRASASYGGQRLQTHDFHTNASWLQQNTDAARALVKAASAEASRHDTSSDKSRHVFHDVPHDTVLRFLQDYSFHEDWAVATTELLSDYISKRVQSAGSLRRWSVAIVGTAPGGGNRFSFAPNAHVGLIVRARLKNPERNDYADIKTLMSRKDAAVDLEGTWNDATEDELMAARTKRAPKIGLIVLYPIDKDSVPATERAAMSREALGAEEHVVGVGIVFPRVDAGDDEVHGYISADLSGITLDQLDEADQRAIEGDDE